MKWKVTYRFNRDNDQTLEMHADSFEIAAKRAPIAIEMIEGKDDAKILKLELVW